MFVLARAATYSALFIGLLLIFLPDRILSSTGITQPAAIGPSQVAGLFLGASGAALALTCILTGRLKAQGSGLKAQARSSSGRSKVLLEP